MFYSKKYSNIKNIYILLIMNNFSFYDSTRTRKISLKALSAYFYNILLDLFIKSIQLIKHICLSYTIFPLGIENEKLVTLRTSSIHTTVFQSPITFSRRKFKRKLWKQNGSVKWHIPFLHHLNTKCSKITGIYFKTSNNFLF